MTWQTPWVISGVTEVPLSVSRVLAYAATGGNEGVVSPTDLEVKALTVPGTSVNVRGGAFSCINRFGSSANESYIGYNIGDDNKAITASGAGGRSDLVWAAITDPGQPNNPGTPAPVETRIIQGVSSTVTRLQDVAGYTNVAGYALARIDIPANTGTILQSYIKDLRQLLNRRNQRELRLISASNTTNQVTISAITASVYQTAHGSATWNVAVPSWATRMAIVGHVAGLRITGTTTQEFTGAMRIKAGSSFSSPTYMNFGLTAGGTDTVSTLVAEDFAVPIGERGTTQNFAFQAYKSGGAATYIATSYSTFVLDIQFYSSIESGT